MHCGAGPHPRQNTRFLRLAHRLGFSSKHEPAYQLLRLQLQLHDD